MASAEIAVAQPWDKMRGESRQAFHNFSVYRDLGPDRSLVKAGRALGKSPATLADQSKKYGWVERADAWDFYNDQKAQAEYVETRRRTDQRQLGLAQGLQAVAGTRLVGRQASEGQARVTALDPNDLEPADVARLAIEGAKLERLVLGLPTDLSKSISDFSPQEVAAIVRELVDLALEDLPPEAHERFLNGVMAIGKRFRP